MQKFPEWWVPFIILRRSKSGFWSRLMITETVQILFVKPQQKKTTISFNIFKQFGMKDDWIYLSESMINSVEEELIKSLSSHSCPRAQTCQYDVTMTLTPKKWRGKLLVSMVSFLNLLAVAFLRCRIVQKFEYIRKPCVPKNMNRVPFQRSHSKTQSNIFFRNTNIFYCKIWNKRMKCNVHTPEEFLILPFWLQKDQNFYESFAKKNEDWHLKKFVQFFEPKISESLGFEMKQSKFIWNFGQNNEHWHFKKFVQFFDPKSQRLLVLKWAIEIYMKFWPKTRNNCQH